MKRMHGRVRTAVSWLPLFLVSVWANAALAHHGMDGRTPDTVATGLLSGLAHPLLALDHLACLLALGLLQRRFSGWFGFVAASALGCALSARLGFELHVDIFTAASVGVFGMLLAARATLSPALKQFLGVGIGLLHGFAYGDPMHEAAIGTTAAYVFGIVAVQAALLYGVGLLVRGLSKERVRLVGSLAVALSVGLVALSLS